jgi:SAM-dependent methyltransferase
MTYGSLHICKKLWEGQSLMRIRMNVALSNYSVTGSVVDIGGGREPDYFSYLNVQGMSNKRIIDQSLAAVDFETDRLPFEDQTIDTALMCNVLEHIFNHGHLVAEAKRILKPSGSLVGFVPFMIGYHPDPKDFFRYTEAALERILSRSFKDVKVARVGGSPVLACMNIVLLFTPRILRPVAYMLMLPFEFIFRKLKPEVCTLYPLGYVFTGRANPPA